MGEPNDTEAMTEVVNSLSTDDIFPMSPSDMEAHETVLEAMNATSTSIASVKRDTKDRKKWLYIMTPESEEWCVAFFQKPEGTPTKIGHSSIGARMVAVWNGNGSVPNCEPQF